jgi:hypothetical protein
MITTLLVFGNITSLVAAFLALKYSAHVDSVKNLYEGITLLAEAVHSDVADLHARIDELEDPIPAVMPLSPGDVN